MLELRGIVLEECEELESGELTVDWLIDRLSLMILKLIMPRVSFFMD